MLNFHCFAQDKRFDCLIEAHKTPDDAIVSSLQQSVRREKNEMFRTRLNDIKNSLTLKTQHAV